MLEREPTEKEIIKQLQEVIKKRKWKEIVFCGFGEPLERLDIVLKISKWIEKHHSIPIRINTNGQGYLINKNRKLIQELIKSGVDRVNVSLNAHNEITYNQICNPKFKETYEHIIKFIKKARGMGLKIEVTAVTIPEIEITKINELAKKMGVKFYSREYIRFFW
jgi:TatD DNase family protein